MSGYFEAPTDAQLRVLLHLCASIVEHGAPPTLHESAKALDFSSTTTIRGHHAALVQRGLVRVLAPGTGRNVVPTDAGWRTSGWRPPQHRRLDGKEWGLVNDVGSV